MDDGVSRNIVDNTSKGSVREIQTENSMYSAQYEEKLPDYLIEHEMNYICEKP